MTPDTETDHGAHDGPCLNYEGQDAKNYDSFDSCYLHITTAEERWRRLERAEAELAVIRGMVEGAITECQLGSAVAAHFGRTLPDTGD